LKKEKYVPNKGLRAARAEKDLTQPEVAAIAGCTVASYSSKENGKRGFTQSEMRRLKAFFKKTTDELFFD